MAEEKKHKKDMNPEEDTPEREETAERETSAEDDTGGERGDGSRDDAGPSEEGGEAASGTRRESPETAGKGVSGGETGGAGDEGGQEGASISPEEAAALEKGLDWLDSFGEDIPDIPDYEKMEQEGGGEEASQAAIDELISSVKANSEFHFETNPSGRQKGAERSASVQPAGFPDMDGSEGPGKADDAGNVGKIDMLMDIPVQITVVLGHAQKTIGEIISLEQGAVVELDKIVGEPVDVLANGKLVFRGEVVVIDENFGVRVVELVKSPVRNAG